MNDRSFPRLDDPEEIAAAALAEDRRLLVFGPMGAGKTTLVARLAHRLTAAGRICFGINADPGSPGFGPPGAVSLGLWRQDAWRLQAIEALCTLNAGRFRMPLAQAVGRLATRVDRGTLLIDAPGVVRGVAGAELLSGLLTATGADGVLLLAFAHRRPPLVAELRALAVDVFLVRAAGSGRIGARLRARERTRLWEEYLQRGERHILAIESVPLLGTPPPRTVEDAWNGRQIALLHQGETQQMAEALRLESGRLWIRAPAPPAAFDAILVRDACRSAAGFLQTAPAYAVLGTPLEVGPSPASGLVSTSLATRVGAVDVQLVNGVFGDPLLHARMRHQRRGLLFDLGDCSRLPARHAHQVTDIFISHAHIDHIGGFLTFLRMRIGEESICRLYGPPGLARHVNGFLRGVLWDRIAERAPRFEVLEWHGEHLRRYRMRAGGRALVRLRDNVLEEGVVLRQPGFRVRAVQLDHHTPVLAYAFEPEMEIKIRKDRLQQLGLEPGPWLTTLKARLRARERQAEIRLPDGRVATAAELAEELTLIGPGRKLVYATDLADTDANRRRLQALARDAHTLFCEACFVEADAEQAKKTGHLTARACGEIAAASGVSWLAPFHFSRRYAGEVETIYEEVAAAFGRLLVPHRDDPQGGGSLGCGPS